MFSFYDKKHTKTSQCHYHHVHCTDKQMYVCRLLFWTQICFSYYFSSFKEFFELNCPNLNLKV